ncbi:MAG: SDR family NAD(P)-dependent oxidoreductase [Legionellaceae bacterium]|nr:SDR family NAD(P)-dependent oxidoreductase [Legionellaceae bacterium]
MTDIANKVAIITGSTSGIGKAIACMLSHYGVKVVLNSVSSVESGNKLKESLPDAIYIQGDIGQEEDCKSLVAKTIQHFGQLDILVNNAGKSLRTGDNPFDISNKVFSETLDINVVGTWCLCREALPYFKQSGDGNIVNLSSSAGLNPASASSGIPYAVSKAAIAHLTKLIAKYAGPEVRANTIAPGLIITPRTENFDEAISKFQNRTPLKRTGVPNDIAELVLAILRSGYINGETISIDGGFSVL